MASSRHGSRAGGGNINVKIALAVRDFDGRSGISRRAAFSHGPTHAPAASKFSYWPFISPSGYRRMGGKWDDQNLNRRLGTRGRQRGVDFTSSHSLTLRDGACTMLRLICVHAPDLTGTRGCRCKPRISCAGPRTRMTATPRPRSFGTVTGTVVPLRTSKRQRRSEGRRKQQIPHRVPSVSD